MAYGSLIFTIHALYYVEVYPSLQKQLLVKLDSPQTFGVLMFPQNLAEH